MEQVDIKKIIQDCGGVQPPHLAFYIESIRFNCDAAMNSIEYVAEFINMTNETKGQYEMNSESQVKILDHLQNIILHAGALSKYFWAVKDGEHKLHKKRGQTLRSHFNLNENSPLKDKKLRNHLEHFDENLDNYLWEKPIVGVVIPEFVGVEAKDDGVPIHFFRAFFIDTGEFKTLGVRYEIQPIVDELYKIYGVLNNHT